MTSQQKTLARSVECRGISLHSGLQVRLRIHPARHDTGIVFQRSDLGGARLKLRRARVVRADHATTLAGRGFTISTVEHLLAALRIMGVDNATIELDGPEVPIMDGSAAPFVYLIRDAGTRKQHAPRHYMILRESVEIVDGDREIAIHPSDRLRVDYTIDFPGTAIGRQSFSRTLFQRVFMDEVAPARTFCFLHDVAEMRKRGLALGGSLDNAVVVDENGPMNKLRFQDEYVRHKTLDLIGDLALLGAPVIGHVVARKAGHALHARLVEAIRASGALEVVEAHEAGSRANVPAVAAASA
jgi:UDP-3-O-[3-hydroxymyristoyl] N-acetylglucosamine deacetylase